MAHADGARLAGAMEVLERAPLVAPRRRAAARLVPPRRIVRRHEVDVIEAELLEHALQRCGRLLVREAARDLGGDKVGRARA